MTRSPHSPVHYQPVVDLLRREVVGVEALTQDGHAGPVLLETAVRQRAAWAAQGLDLEVAVRLRMDQVVDPAVVGTVRDLVGKPGQDPARVLLEITERSLTDEARVGAALHGLAELGVQLVLNDFGSGHSSLLFLRRYPVSGLKVDATFVGGLGVSRDDEAIVASIVSLAANLGIRCTADGVDDRRQHAHLLGHRCHAQGALFSPPVPAAALPAAVDRAEAALLLEEPAGPRTRSRSARLSLAEDVADRIHTLHREGASLETIAAALNQDGAVHPLGIRWHSRFVDRYLAVRPAAGRR